VRVVQQSERAIEMTDMPIDWIVGLGGILAILAIALLRAIAEGALNGILIALILIAALGWITANEALRRVTLRADRAAGTLQIDVTTPLGRQVNDYPLAGVSGLEIETRHHRRNSMPQPVLTLLLHQDGAPVRQQLPLFQPYPVDLLYASQCFNTWLAERAHEVPHTSSMPQETLL
jgi:hypothetical protein